MRGRGSKGRVWSALLAGVGGGGLALWACLPSRAPQSPSLALAPEPADSAPSPRFERPSLDGVAVVNSGQVEIPRGFRIGLGPGILSQVRGWAQSNESLYAAARDATDLRRIEILDRAFLRASDPMVRQNLIFLVALSQDWKQAEPWLRLRLAEGGEDGRDALWALAMSGCERSLRALEAAPPETLAPLLVDTPRQHEALGLAGAEHRPRLRAYRALEVVDRTPYFKKTAIWTHLRWFPHPQAPAGRPENLTWIDDSRTAPPALLPRLWALWIRSFPGHPGSDDVALRLGQAQLAQREYLAAARWFSRASVLPDQDVTWVAHNYLLATAELLLGEAALDELVSDAELSGRNRELLQYVRLRRLAAAKGCAVALVEAARLVKAAPKSALAQAWARRWTVAPPEGLGSGVEPLPLSDPLFRRDADLATPPESSLAIARGVPFAGAALGQATTLGRLDPHPEAIRFDVSRLARQLRLWETEAALAQREASAEPSQAADLRYKRAALFFYQPDALFPAYARYRRCAEDVLSLWIYEPTDKDSYEAAITSFAQSAQGWSRCATLLAGFETRYPTYAGLDEALFTRGLCFERLLRSGWCRDQEGVIKTLVSALETLTTTCPESPLSDDAGRAARYWRSNWSEFFPPPSPGR